MRSAGSAVLVIVALLLAAVAGPSIWMQRNVVDEAGFVQLAGPLGANKEFQDGLANVVATQSAAQLALPPQLQNLAAELIATVARSLSSQHGYADAWAETLRRSHALTFAPTADQNIAGELNLDIAPLVGLVANNVSADVGVKLPVPSEVLISVDQPAVAKTLPLVSAVAGAGVWFMVFAVALFALAVVVARYKARTVVLAGLGLALVVLAWLLGSNWVAGRFVDISPANDVAAQFGSQLGELVKESWQWGIAAGFIVAGCLVVVGVLARMVRRTPTA
ncbi:hypothetical protein [Arthrobacter alpinus]|uniref:hypothetical protein n=1 Tax=Arthrobacter alpinus TaxID=656366 RepID=UPI000A6F087D|nr:hypothetical protein [Arthrobacter alpinus]